MCVCETRPRHCIFCCIAHAPTDNRSMRHRVLVVSGVQVITIPHSYPTLRTPACGCWIQDSRRQHQRHADARLCLLREVNWAGHTVSKGRYSRRCRIQGARDWTSAGRAYKRKRYCRLVCCGVRRRMCGRRHCLHRVYVHSHLCVCLT